VGGGCLWCVSVCVVGVCVCCVYGVCVFMRGLCGEYFFECVCVVLVCVFVCGVCVEWVCVWSVL